jgi:hypothetical protein
LPLQLQCVEWLLACHITGDPWHKGKRRD